MGLSVFWFKRDLRVEDNPALAAAAARGPVVPVYVIEPEYWAQAEASERQFGFLLETLGALDEALKALGCGLVVRVGDAVDALAGVVREVGAGAIYASEETGTSWTFRRDLKVAEWARGAGI
ncbi:MAG: deoxyribodipyrimidine photo-lyase, partial [Rhodobacteraceae bacterium]|nr:deoxyribodipyrimidine photo-lyase [Paracoccaceae bacterium]